MSIFEELESEVRSYSRGWPVVFDRAQGSYLHSEDGKPYLDFFAGAGALNYGHNNPALKQALIDYISRYGVTHSLDMYTVAKRDFLEAFKEKILGPRDLDYKVVFPGPGRANADGAAVTPARKVTGKESVNTFTTAFPGMSLGALPVSGNSMTPGAAAIPRVHASPMPYDNYFDGAMPRFRCFEKLLAD